MSQQELLSRVTRCLDDLGIDYMESGAKVDFWVLKDHPFDISRFARKRRESLGAGEVGSDADLTQDKRCTRCVDRSL
jgi:hypothetical protein